MRAIANLHARVRQQESSILGAAKPASSLSLSLSLFMYQSFLCLFPSREEKRLLDGLWRDAR